MTINEVDISRSDEDWRYLPVYKASFLCSNFEGTLIHPKMLIRSLGQGLNKSEAKKITNGLVQCLARRAKCSWIHSSPSRSGGGGCHQFCSADRESSPYLSMMLAWKQKSSLQKSMCSVNVKHCQALSHII